MRTPWRFVADLVSRKPKPHDHDESPAVESKTIPLEYKPVPEEEQPVLDATTAGPSPQPVSEAQVDAQRLVSDTETKAGTTASISAEAAAVAVGGDEPTSPTTTQGADGTPPASTGIEAAGGLVKPASQRRKKAMATVEPVDSTDTVLPEPPAVATIPRSFADEMAALDAEVTALRRQLAKKLVEQNAQLRKMLTRFGGR